MKPCNPGGLGITTPYVHRKKTFVGEKPSSRAAASAEAGPSNLIRAQLAVSGSKKTAQNQVYELDDDDEEDIQEVEAKTIPKLNGKRKETHVVEDEEEDEIQEVDPPPPKTTKSRGGSRKPSSTVNEKPALNGAVTKGKAKAKTKIGPPKSVQKHAPEPMDMDSNDVVEHEMDVDVNETGNIIQNNVGRAFKIQQGRQHDDRTMARLEEELRQVRFTLICNH